MITVNKIPFIRGEISVAADKSISHRAIMISSIAKGRSMLNNLLRGEDCQATINAFKGMGVSIVEKADKDVVVKGNGLRGLKPPKDSLYLGNSGTTMRLILGILAGQDFETIVEGDPSLSRRPMKRVTHPLILMGAQIQGNDNANLAPITIHGKRSLEPITFNSPVASAQVKSSIMFAGLYAGGRTKVTEPYKSRDHTERMLKLFGADVKEDGLTVSVEGLAGRQLAPQEIEVPGDISSAAFFIALAVIAKDAEIRINNCGINPTRTGIITVLRDMGADIEMLNMRKGFEPVADIIVKSSSLKAVKVERDMIPLLIDEIPLIALCATQAEGTTRISGISELRVKETDRENALINNLKAFGADIKSEEDTLIIKGPGLLRGASVKSFGDHRTAMMSVIAGSIAEGETSVSDTACIAISFPDFMDILKTIS